MYLEIRKYSTYIYKLLVAKINVRQTQSYRIIIIIIIIIIIFVDHKSKQKSAFDDKNQNLSFIFKKIL